MSRLRILLTAMCAAAIACLTASAGDARYIFYFIGDGMGHGQVAATQLFTRQAEGMSGLRMTSLPVASFATTYSASSPVTDSAAAGTALATGHKTRNGMLGMTPDSVAVPSVATRLHDAGYGVGIITTVAADDATPGAFYAHVPYRKQFEQIGRHAAESGFEVIAGASLQGFTDPKTGADTGLADYIASQGVQIVRGTEAMLAAEPGRVIMFPDVPVWDWNVGYAADSIPGAMTIDVMLDATIRRLERLTPDAFFIMAEGGSIDHAGHANDGGSIIRETMAFDRAIARALDFYALHPDETLIVVTADHETGGVTVGNNHTRYNALTQYLQPQRYSKERFSRLCDTLAAADTLPTWDDMKRTLAEGFGFWDSVPLTQEQERRLEEMYRAAFVDKNVDRQNTLYAAFHPFAVEVFDILNTNAGIGFTTLAHTGNPVPVFAIGAGANSFSHDNDNTRIPAKILEASTAATPNH